MIYLNTCRPWLVLLSMISLVDFAFCISSLHHNGPLPSWGKNRVLGSHDPRAQMVSIFYEENRFAFQEFKASNYIQKIVGTRKCLRSLKKNTFCFMTSGKMTSAWATFKPNHKWAHFEHNSWVPQTERKESKSQRMLEGWIHSEFRKALRTFVRKKPKLSFCNSLQSLILWKVVSGHFPESLFLMDVL
jgi:hypothetical protein